ncbi:MAG: DUF364 domain-containing protein [Oscillospiraceae bacterium]|jgi:uncharacterized protein (DUF4213/DUF364 family)|nr:DUF364 domain-containing protein [Oscillospiraceae bacterium]
MWDLYDSLIEGIPPDVRAEFFACGATHSIVVADDGGVGVSGALDETWRPPLLTKKEFGMPLRGLAECVKSWEFIEAGLGLAAINAWYNGGDRLRALGIAVSDKPFAEDRASDPFIALQNEIRGKRVTVIGHFPYIDRLFAPVCDMSVIEKFSPVDGDYPDQAADYLLPESDYVFIASYTLVEKTLPRYLRLSKNARVTLVGPATPVTPILHGFGVRDLSGFYIRDAEAARNYTLTHGGNIHKTGQKINLRRSAGGAEGEG